MGTWKRDNGEMFAHVWQQFRGWPWDAQATGVTSDRIYKITAHLNPDRISESWAKIELFDGNQFNLLFVEPMDTIAASMTAHQLTTLSAESVAIATMVSIKNHLIAMADCILA